MRSRLKRIGLRFTTGHTVLAAALGPFVIALFLDTPYEPYAIAVVGLTVVVALITFRGRRLTGWVATLFASPWRHRVPLEPPSEPEVGATAMPGDHVAIRWQGESLCALIELIPRPFTPIVIVDGRARTDDVIDTRLVEQLLSVHCPDLEADVVSAGYRVGKAASADVLKIYGHSIGPDPAPARRRTWIMLRAFPLRTREAAQRRDDGVGGLSRYLVASTTRMAEALASHGVDAACERSFDDYDHATDIGFERERWSRIKGRDTVTTAYIAPGGPDIWWSVSADHTITRFRIVSGMAPRSTVLLTTETKVKPPKGFTRLSGAQRAAMQGQTIVTDSHYRLPIGSAGVLVGETMNRHPMYLPFDVVDTYVEIGDTRTFTQFAMRAAAAGGIVTLSARFEAFAGLIGAQTGPEAKVAWPHATTHLDQHPGIDRVVLGHDHIDTPRHRQIPMRLLTPSGEERYEMALPGRHERSSNGRRAPVAFG